MVRQRILVPSSAGSNPATSSLVSVVLCPSWFDGFSGSSVDLSKALVLEFLFSLCHACKGRPGFCILMQDSRLKPWYSSSYFHYVMHVRDVPVFAF